ARRPVYGRAVLPHGEIVRDRDRLAMSDQEAVIRALVRRPRADFDRHAGPSQVDRSAAAEVVAVPVGRKVLIVGTPAKLSGLPPFAHEAIDRPGVRKFIALLARLRDLGIALGAMDALDSEPHGEPAPLIPRLRDRYVARNVARDIHHALLDPV